MQDNQTNESTVDRRDVMKRAGLGALGLGALAGAGALLPTRQAQAQTADIDVAVLNFALNLEYLEASYYLYAVTGTGLTAAQTLGGNGVAGGAVTAPTSGPVKFQTSAIAAYAETIAADENAHVNFLRSALGSAAAPAPAIDIVNSFTTLAIAAKLIAPGQVFNPYQDEISFLIGAYIFEDVGVTAYSGAAALITDKGYLTAAASILSVEAYHAGTVRTLLAIRGGGAVTDAISALRSTLSANSVGTDDFGTLQAGGGLNVFPGDVNALTFPRSTRQVLNIVYGDATGKAASGLFFPNGLSGAIAS